MNQSQIKNQQSQTFQYLGLAKITACQNCQERGCQIYQYENMLTQEKVNTCYSCIKDFAISKQPKTTIIRLEKGTISQPPIKEFLVKNSWLVELNEKENLNLLDKARLQRIFANRDQTFNELVRTIAKYYHLANKGDYRFDGMPEIKRGIRGWIEDKLWRLLISISEPNHLRYLNYQENPYWEEA